MLVLHSESFKMVGIFHKWKLSHTRRSYLIRLAINTSLLFPKIIISLFSLKKSCSSSHLFSLVQTTKLNLNWPTTLQQPWTNWLAPTTWTLASVKRDLDVFLGPKLTPTLWKNKLKVFKREEKNAEVRLRQNLLMGETDFH